MAKWGEGDPRWIVEERADATNVNNWHWTEKNASNWSKDKIKNLLTGLKVECDDGWCEIKEVTKVEGEASASNRKAKLIFFYEWEVEADWTGQLDDSKTKYKGTLKIPNLSEENDPSDIDVIVTVKNESDEAFKVKEILRKKGTPMIQEQIAKYIKDLKVEFSQGMILPAKGAVEKPRVPSPATTNLAKQELSKPIMGDSAKPVGVKIHTKKLTDKQKFKCRASDLYRALTEKEMVQAFTRNSMLAFEAEKGGGFVLFDGYISGTFTDLTPHERIEMRWRCQNWPDEHYSNVTFEFKEGEDETVLHITQTGIPSTEFERTKEGWERYYWESIRQTFGFGVRLI
ncbi:activator of 90 kDa heat shock protein ATPase homolog 1 [Lingula anatina]|uniref:Activator of 90 kDa heat shock protein ATPase homolog 1 n=1 Tax=Lingula anatina TaxID=7574 RepID=A0A1S3IKC9_LINAN|nr:activator of 90 kDa heat shock protein ATPase homolog 1 [Lingula anatina]|eukprot:XP_013398700.1 activator of 90 kDa heat shock protein ATPase homolog 1 [Lingula anatina]